MPEGAIVVGVDGSEGADKALEWAIEEARVRDALLRCVAAWEFPYVGDIAGFAPVDIGKDLEARAREIAEAAAARAREAGVEAEVVVAEGAAASVLTDTAARPSDLLVVGSRGRGGFAGLLLGSVSQQVTHHARCPVVIVPHDD